MEKSEPADAGPRVLLLPGEMTEKVARSHRPLIYPLHKGSAEEKLGDGGTPAEGEKVAFPHVPKILSGRCTTHPHRVRAASAVISHVLHPSKLHPHGRRPRPQDHTQARERRIRPAIPTK